MTNKQQSRNYEVDEKNPKTTPDIALGFFYKPL